MRVRAEVGLVLGALLCVQVVTSFGAIAVLNRMTPAIAEILRENLYSLQAVDDMLTALALSEVRPQLAESQFERALSRAHRNVTEEDERPALAAIDARYRLALRGEASARDETLRALQALSSVNHASTRRADAAARELGSAGAWAVALLGGLGFVLSAIALRRLTRKLVNPVSNLEQTVLAYRHGNLLCRTARGDMPAEFRRVAEALDELLDARTVSPSAEGHSSGALERKALVHLLSARDAPTVLVDGDRRVVALGSGALELLDDSESGGKRLGEIRAGPTNAAPGTTWIPLEGGHLCVLGEPTEHA